MKKQDFKGQDTYGRNVESTYSIIGDAGFISRLKNFDPNLELVFDKRHERWVVIEKAHIGNEWNIILVAEDDDGNPKPVGEWMLNTLYVYHQKWLEKANVGADAWLDNMVYEAEEERKLIDAKASDDHQAMIREDITQWRKAAKELDNQPSNDATAGYQGGKG